MRRTKEQAAATREAILDAAVGLITERGLDGVSLDQIAEAAGVKRGAVHFHFVNKLGLLIALCDREQWPLQELVRRLEGAPAKAPLDDFLEVVTETMHSFNGDRRRSAIFRAFLSTALQLDAEGHRVFMTFHRKLMQLHLHVFHAAAKQGQLAKPWTPTSAAQAAQACVLGILLEWVTTEGETPLVPDGAQVLRSLVATFGVPRPAPKGATRITRKGPRRAPSSGTTASREARGKASPRKPRPASSEPG
jgi:TetR/AcrR family acrAB operon transcriptional repressor